MWDLDQIVRNNNNAAVDWFMRGNRVNKASNPVLTEWPLTILASKMVSGPVRLGKLIDLINGGNVTQVMLRLADKFLPEHSQEIIATGRRQWVNRFCELFSEKYYQLGSYVYKFSLDTLLNSLPVELMGLSNTAYHDFEFRQGYTLLLSLVVYPFESEDNDWYEDGDDGEGHEHDGGRIPLLDIVQNNAGPEVVSKIIEGGWLPDELHEMTDGTKYDGLGAFADWACGCTGCIVLDYSYGDCPYAEGESEPIFNWSKYNVDYLSSQAKEVEEIRNKLDGIVNWVEANPDENFAELVDFLAKKYKKPKNRKISAFHGEIIDLEMIEDQDSFDEMREEFYGKEDADEGFDGDGDAVE